MTIWMSQSGIYESMAAATPPLDDHAIEVTMAGTQCNRILWCCSDRNILCIGTEGGEWILTGAEGDALTPLKPDVPAANLLRIRAAGAGRNPRGFKSALCPVRRQVNPRILLHLPVRQLPVRGLVRPCAAYPRPSIIFAAWQGDPYNILWCVLANGTMAAVTYLKEQEVIAWHRHDTDGPIKGHCGPSRRQWPDANLDARRTQRRALRGTPAALQGSHPDRTRA